MADRFRLPGTAYLERLSTSRTVVGGKKGQDGRKQDEELTAHNIEYFGDPVYEYSIGAGQEDGEEVLVHLEEYTRRLAEHLVDEAPSVADLRENGL